MSFAVFNAVDRPEEHDDDVDNLRATVVGIVTDPTTAQNPHLPHAAVRERRRASPVRTGSVARYKLSFTAGGLFVQSGPLAARLYQDLRDWRAVRDAIDADNLLQARTASSARRNGQEIVQRLETLTALEVGLLADGAPDERAQLLWVAACRRYSLIAEFASEVLRERFLLMAADITYEHFDTFLRGRMLWRPELISIKTSTQQKLRSSVFLMMREAKLILDNGRIVPAVLSWRVREELSKQQPSDLRIFPTREAV